MAGYDPLNIEAQEEAKEQAECKARLAAENEEADFKWLMGSKRGRRIVWRLLDRAGVFRSSFSTIAMQMAFNEGHRNFGNITLDMCLQYCPDLFQVMMKENTNGRRDGNNASHHNDN